MVKEGWFWIITIMLIICVFHAVHGCWEEERTRLLHIKAHLSSPYSSSYCFKGWKEDKTSDCCNGWEGVSCGIHGRVVTLSLRGCMSAQVQHLNTSIFHPFQQLIQLDLAFNHIVSWQHVQDVGKVSPMLQKLEKLDLSYNSINRSVDILTLLKGLHSLKSLSLQENQISGFIRLCDIEALTNLEELDLSGNNIYDFMNCNGSTKWSSSHTNLKTLDLTDNVLNNEALQHLSMFQSLEHLRLQSSIYGGIKQPYDVGKVSPMLKKLEKLDLSDNRINRSVDILPQLKGLHSLKSLSLKYNKISGFIRLCDIEALTNLEELDLSYNSIYGFMNCNGLSLCLLQKLQTLDLSHNELNEMLPPCFGNLSALRVLDLSFNQLAGRIPSWLSNLSALQQLNLSQNHLTGNIASSALNHTTIEILELSGNHFKIPSSFKSFANYTKLKHFTADDNELIYDTEEPHLALRFQLQVLSLSNCKLNTYPPFLHHQYNLLVLDLSCNSLQGNFPTWLLETSYSLKGLFLHNNSISSFQLSSSFHHANMVALDISLNKIQGPILEHIGEIFPRLQLLYMFSNELQGNIPSSLGHLKSLRQLDLSNNSLVGTLPNSLLEGCSLLQSLIVSNNRLEGLIPSFYLQQDLEILVLGNNLMEGPIPRDICRLHKLDYLDLSQNKLDGSIPSCFSNLSIERIHLSNNKLSGPIVLPRNYVVTLDLSNNKLKGSIPSQIANLAYLNVLLLSGNALEDEIPLQLCSLTELMILDLSHNMLSGSLPSCLGRVAFRNTQEMGIITDESLPDDLVDTYAEKVQDAIGFVEDPVNFMTKSMPYSYKLGTLDVLSGIDLSCNMLTGKIPHEFGNLTHIHSINLSHNHLWGEIPETFSNLTQIESLDISYNNFSGRIPTELTALHFLSVLRVEHNNLSGEIPVGPQFSTFDESSFQGNPFLCGPPLQKTCAPKGLSPADPNGRHDQVVEDDSGGIDMETFYLTFLVTGITMFLLVLVMFWINGNWLMAWYCLATRCFLSSFYFAEDSIRKIKRVVCI